MIINFKLSELDSATVGIIAERALKMAQKHAKGQPMGERTLQDWRMDITACHNMGMKLKLRQLAFADDFNFAHDVFGIARHLNRETGAIEDCFVPRFAA